MRTSPKRPEPPAAQQSQTADDQQARIRAAQPADADPSRIVLGRVLGAFGVRGWLKIKPLGRDAGSLLTQPVWCIEGKGPVRELQVEEVKEHGGAVLAKAAGIEDREQADALRGADVTIARAVLPEAAPGEYYWSDLIGLTVRNEQGLVLGTVSGLIDAPAHDVLRVAALDEARELLIPFVEPIVCSVDVAGRSITVDWQKDY